MDTVPITPNLAMLRIKGWQVYVWRDDDSVTLIDTGAPGSSAEILCAVEVPIYQRVSVGLPDVAPPVPVDRELVDGDVLAFGGDAEILAIPGHTEGSIAIHLPHHGMLFTGDTIASVGTVMLGTFNQDREQTAASFRRLAALDVEIACFGHGEPIASGAGDRIREVLPH